MTQDIGFADARIVGRLLSIQPVGDGFFAYIRVPLRDGARADIRIHVLEAPPPPSEHLNETVMAWGELRGGGEICVPRGWGEFRLFRTMLEREKTSQPISDENRVDDNLMTEGIKHDDAPVLVEEIPEPMRVKERKISPGTPVMSKPAFMQRKPTLPLTPQANHVKNPRPITSGNSFVSSRTQRFRRTPDALDRRLAEMSLSSDEMD
jgi:hypothetical protein